jgi:hypothetical protein
MGYTGHNPMFSRDIHYEGWSKSQMYGKTLDIFKREVSAINWFIYPIIKLKI